MASSSETISVLRDLIETCREGTEGYRAAATRVDDGDLRSLFEQYARQRAEFLGELEHEVLRLGEDPRPMPTIGEAVDHAWVSVREALTSNDREAVIAECERGEDEAVATYREALDAPLPGPIHSLVERQYASVVRAHDQLRSIERGIE